MKIYPWLLLGLVSLAACRYDREEELFAEPTAGGSDSVSYDATIRPLLQKYCTGCHAGNAPQAGISLTTYQDVKRYADSGQLLGSVTHERGFSAMPKDQARLPDADIDHIRRWIAQGSLNN